MILGRMITAPDYVINLNFVFCQITTGRVPQALPFRLTRKIFIEATLLSAGHNGKILPVDLARGKISVEEHEK